MSVAGARRSTASRWSLRRPTTRRETNVRGTDAVISFPLTAGTHEIVLTYRSRGLVPGLTISGVCLLAFLALVIALRRRPVLLPDERDGLDPAERVGRRARRRAALATLAGGI